MDVKEAKRSRALVDKTIVGKRFGASASSYDKYAIAQQHIYERLDGLLATLGRTHFDSALEVGTGTAGLSKYLDARYTIARWTLNDLGQEMLQYADFTPRVAPPPTLIIGDAEQADLGEGYDLIVSASALQWFHDPERFVRSLRSRLRPGGVLLLSTFGTDNLIEIKTLTDRGLDYAPLGAVRGWLSQYSEVHLEEEVYPLCFASPRDVLLHLKRTGVTGTGESANFWSVDRLRAFERAYTERFAMGESGVRLSYHPIYIRAKK